MRYDAKAIGSGSEGAQTELQDKYKKVSHSPIHLGVCHIRLLSRSAADCLPLCAPLQITL